MTRSHYRIDRIVPSSNATTQTDIAAMPQAREAGAPERFSVCLDLIAMGRAHPCVSEQRRRALPLQDEGAGAAACRRAALGQRPSAGARP